MKNIKQIEGMKLIPLQPYTKKPSEKWATNETLQVDENIISYGIDTGRSNLVVIDCDVNDNVDGVEKFLNIVEKEGYDLKTFTVETPNGGLHFYFKVPNDYNIKGSIGTVFGAGIDIRANGGYVVGPGSKVKNKNNEVVEYLIEDETTNISDLPLWLLESIQAKNNTKTTKNTVPNNTNKTNNKKEDNAVTSEKEELDRKAAVEWAMAKMEIAVEGERQKILNNTSYFLGRKRVDRNEASALINAAINRGLSRSEAENSFNHGYDDGIKDPTLSYEVMVKEYNTKNNISIKEDPLDTGFYTHFSLAYNFWKKNRDNFIYYIGDKSWYEYSTTTGCWEKIDEETIKLSIKTFLEKIVTDVRANNTNIRPNVYTLQEKLWSRATVESVTVVARMDFSNRKKNLFDNDPYLINCNNGVFDLKNEELLDHSPNFYMTKFIPVNYVENATDKYCDDILDSLHPDEKDYVQLIVGQSLIGEQTKYQAAYFMHGRGSNGKSTFIDLILKTSGSYAKLQPPSVFMPEKSSDSYALSDFEGLRAAIIEELPDSKHLNSGALKRLVGTKKVNARPIYGKNKEFDNESTIFVSCNRLPMINETDDGTWRRLIVFTFPYSYKKSEEQVKGKWDRLGNPRVLYSAQNKRTTAEAFLAWRVEGAKRWLREERVEYHIPNHIDKVITEWNENNDLLLNWFNDSIVVNPKSYISFADLYQSFNNWLGVRGNANVSQRYFSETIKNHKVFHDNNLIHRNKMRALKDFTQSLYNFSSKEYGGEDKFTHIVGIKFKD